MSDFGDDTGKGIEDLAGLGLREYMLHAGLLSGVSGLLSEFLSNARGAAGGRRAVPTDSEVVEPPYRGHVPVPEGVAVRALLETPAPSGRTAGKGPREGADAEGAAVDLEFATVRWDRDAAFMSQKLDAMGVSYSARGLGGDVVTFSVDAAQARAVLNLVDAMLDEGIRGFGPERFPNLDDFRARAAGGAPGPAEGRGSGARGRGEEARPDPGPEPGRGEAREEGRRGEAGREDRDREAARAARTLSFELDVTCCSHALELVEVALSRAGADHGTEALPDGRVRFSLAHERARAAVAAIDSLVAVPSAGVGAEAFSGLDALRAAALREPAAEGAPGERVFARIDFESAQERDVALEHLKGGMVDTCALGDASLVVSVPADKGGREAAEAVRRALRGFGATVAAATGAPAPAPAPATGAPATPTEGARPDGGAVRGRSAAQAPTQARRLTR